MNELKLILGERCTNQSQNFKCDNQNCINKRLVCDGINNCGDKSDEKGCVDRTGISKN